MSTTPAPMSGMSSDVVMEEDWTIEVRPRPTPKEWTEFHKPEPHQLVYKPAAGYQIGNSRKMAFCPTANPLEEHPDYKVASYGVDLERLDHSRASAADWRGEFATALPPEHLTFFRNLELSLSFGDYLFVHAGLRPGVPLSAQGEADLIWIRSPFLNHMESFGKIVVHGHTPGNEPVMRPNRIGIDTGACFTGRLTALRLAGTSRRFLQT